MKPINLSFFIFFSFLFTGYAQLSNKHWIPPLHANETGDSSLVKDHYIYLSTPSTTPFQVTVTTGNGAPINGSPFTISNGSPVRISIGTAQNSPMMVPRTDVGVVRSNNGLILEGQYDFYVNFRVRADNHAEFLSSKGRTGAGTVFRLGSLPQTSSGGIRNFVASFMATENNTTVNLTDYNTAITFIQGNTTITSPNQTFTLNQGQSIVISGYTNTTANYAGFVGALVTSNKPIVVNSGNMTGGMLTATDGQDFNLDQIVPLSQVGTEYIVMKGNGSINSERPLVVAHEDNTAIFVNGNTTPIATINAGEYYLIPTSNFQGAGTNLNMYIETSKPAFMYQIIAGTSSDATTGMFFIPPVSCFWQKSVDLIPAVDKIGNFNYPSGGILIATEALDTDGVPTIVRINGVPTTTSPVPVAGNPNWVTYRIPNLSGDVAVTSTAALAVGVFGAANVAGFGGYFSGFGSIPNDTTIDVCDGSIIDLFEKIPGNPDTNGVWSYNGVPRNPNNGLFDPSVDLVGEYVYTFTKTCNGVTRTYPIKVIVNAILPGPSAGVSTTASFCKTDAPTDLFTLLGSNVTTGGNWTFNNSPIANGVIDPANAQSGTYTYTIPSQGICDTVSASVEVTIKNSPLLENVPDFSLCDDTNSGSTTDGISLFDLTTKNNDVFGAQTNVSVKYYTVEADAESNATNAITSINAINNTVIYFRIENTEGCYKIGNFQLLVYPLPTVIPSLTLKQCDNDNDAIADFVLTQANTALSTEANLTFSYHNSLLGAQNNTDLVTNDQAHTATNGATVWARIENENGCFRTAQINLVVSTTQFPSTFNPQPLEECDVYLNNTNVANDGYAVFDIETAYTNYILGLFPASQQPYLTVSYFESVEDAELLQNQINNTTNYTNTTQNAQTIWVRVDSALNLDAGCKGIQQLQLIVNPIPDVNLQERIYICVAPETGIGSQIIDATPANSGVFSYEWSSTIPGLDLSAETNPTYTASTEGTYFVTITNTTTGCSISDSVAVLFSSEPLTFTASVETPAFSSNLTTIVSEASGGYGEYEYSLDGINWQSSGTFINLPNNTYTVYVRDIQGCGIKFVENLYAITYPNFFTPNGDGYNDNWVITGLPNSFAAKIYIFDRYGKLLKQISPNGEGWNGTFNGKPLPASDYWFKIEYIENNEAKEFMSHFSLKR
ncbi:T9SS type B sorting domain-containing protein [Flavobacterium sp.]|uniref:T9SS type B sorting domain-containing protein n=1 Tax=Flavobacterium sp. TaxID=239 RepID=UPI003529BE98